MPPNRIGCETLPALVGRKNDRRVCLGLRSRSPDLLLDFPFLLLGPNQGSSVRRELGRRGSGEIRVVPRGTRCW